VLSTVRLCLERCVRCWAPPFKKGGKVLEHIQREGNPAGRGAGGHVLWGAAEDPGFVSFGEKGAEGLMALCSFLKRGCGEGGAELFSLGSRTPGNVSKLRRGRFRLDLRKHFFTERVVNPGTGFPERRSMPQARRCLWHLDNARKTVPELLVSPEVVRQLDQMILVGPLQLNYSIFYSIPA